MWSTVKSKINQNYNTSIVSVAGKTVDPLKEILDFFAKSFVVMLTGFALLSISSCIKYFQSKITNHSPTHRSKLEIKMFNQDDVKKGLSQIDSKSSPGYCGNSASILSATANELSLPITSFFNLCLDSGQKFLLIARLLSPDLTIKVKVASRIQINIDLSLFFPRYLNSLNH